MFFSNKKIKLRKLTPTISPETSVEQNLPEQKEKHIHPLAYSRNLLRRRIKEDSFDEFVIDAEAKSRNSLESPVSNRAFSFVFFLALIFSLIVFCRLLYLNFFEGTFFSERAEANMSRSVQIPAPRGLITDRFSIPLLENKPTFSAVLNLVDFFKDEVSQETILKKISEIFKIDSVSLKEKLSNINLEKTAELVIKKDLSLSEALEAKSLKINSLQIIDDYRRDYTFGPVFAHLIGYTGEVSSSDIIKDKKISLGDEIGKSGLELFYNSFLEGEKGESVNYKNAREEIIENKSAKNPIPGKTLKLNIDSEFQRFFYRRMGLALENLGRQAGVGLAFNPQNGEILAALSFPSFDPNAFILKEKSDERKSILFSKELPLFNRFTSGIYNPGSTIKPLVSVAALKEKIVTPDKSFFSPGFIEIPNPYNPETPSRFLDWKPQGWVNLYSALARSSNVYFYYLGGGFEGFKGLGINKLNEWWRRFNLNEKTGIDLPGEETGFLPNPEEKEKRTGQPWRIGDTYNVTIGQGDVAITPLELLNYIGAIANGGKILKLRVAKDSTSEILKDISYLAPEIKEVQKGMEDAVEKDYGTAHILNDLPFKVAAKTGSAQVSNNKKTNAFFVGYAPAENPEIAILVLVENAREGSLNTVPIAKEVLYWYYTNRL